MGGCFSISLPCDQTVNQVSQWLCLKGSYVHNLRENLASLEKAIEVLKAKRDDVQRRVNREEFTGQQRRLSQVEVWLNNVLAIDNQVSDLLSTNEVEIQKLCLCGFCSKDLKQSYRYGKSVITMLKEIKSIGSQGQFEVVAERIHVAEVEQLPIQSKIVGQETLLERAWDHLMVGEVGIVGLYGMGGVGKTTLLKQINNKFSEISGRFDVVIWIVVSNGATVYKIQTDIATKLGLKGEEWDQKNENQRAIEIHNILRRKKFVLLLDDIWEQVNLETVGVPDPSRENGCKIAFTTRSKEVCGSMGVDDPMQVYCLDPDKAWDLFQKKVGVNTLRSHEDIPQLAKIVTSKCGGLPLALNVIGETMACKRTVQEWHHAINILTSSTIEFSGMKNKILPILKFSYDNLKEEQVQSCFLYCSLFPEDHRINKEMLIEYWICEGYIDEKEGGERALNQGYEILGILVRASLLVEETRNKLSVSMHDVVREMALWITSDFGKHKDRCIVQSQVGLHELPKVKNWRVVEKISLMDNKMKEMVGSHECPQLTTLFLQRNYKLVNISGEFFQSMSRLLVLDLSGNNHLDTLPEEISKLVSLRYLNLSYTEIKRLPLGLQALKMLIYLNLEYTRRLESVNGISNLSSLRTFRLMRSKTKLDMSLMKELELLEHLELVSIIVSLSMIEEQQLFDSKVWRCIQEVHIEHDSIEEAVRMLVLPVMVDLRVVHIVSHKISEIKIDLTSWTRRYTNPCFSNLSYVNIRYCYGLKDLTWLLFASNLTRLYVGSSSQLEAIISKEKAASFLEKEKCVNIPFRKLEKLELRFLPELKSIHWTSLPFPCLREIHLTMCDNLWKLPLDSQSVSNVENFVISYTREEREERFEWEDEATKLRFLPSLKTY